MDRVKRSAYRRAQAHVFRNGTDMLLSRPRKVQREGFFRSPFVRRNKTCGNCVEVFQVSIARWLKQPSSKYIMSRLESRFVRRRLLITRYKDGGSRVSCSPLAVPSVVRCFGPEDRHGRQA